MIVKGTILLVLSVIIASAKHGGHYRDLSSAAKGYGWHCVSGQHTGTKLPGNLVTERAPCLKITHPSDGYATISPLEDHYQFEIDVLARGVDDGERPLPSVLIEWFQVRAAVGRLEDAQIQRLNDCRNDQVCNVLIRRTDPLQKLFQFRVAVSYVGHDETSSEDIVLEAIGHDDNDLDGTLAPKTITSTDATSAAQLNSLPTPDSVHQTHRKPFTGEVERNNFVEALERLHLAKKIAPIDHRNPFLPRAYWKSVPAPVVDDTPFVLENVLNSIVADQPIQDDDVGTSNTRHPPRQSPFNDYLQPLQLVDRKPKLGDYITDDDEATVFIAPVSSDRNKGYAVPNKDETSRNAKLCLDASSEVNFETTDQPISSKPQLQTKVDHYVQETTDQPISSKPQLQTKVDHYVQESLLPGLDNIRTNISKILDILTRFQNREQNEVKETTFDQDTSSTVTNFPHPLVSRNDSYNTTGENSGTNATSLAKLAKMAHGLLEKSSKHLSESYDDFEKHSSSKKNHIKRMLTAVDNLKAPKAKVKRSNSNDVTQFGDVENSARQRPIRSIAGFPSKVVSAEYNHPGTNKGNVRMASGNQRHLNSYALPKKVQKDFLSIWDEFGLEGENQPGISHESSEESDATEEIANVNVQTEVMTIVTPEHGVALRKDIIILQQTTQDISILETDEDQLNVVETDIMTIVTPEPGVALRKDLIVVQPTAQDLLITVPEEDQLNAVETDIMTIVTPEPGVALRKDLIVVQPTTQDLSFAVPEEDQLNAVETNIMTIVTPEPGVALRKDMIVVQPMTQDLSILETEEDQLNAVETDIMTIVTPEPRVALRKDIIVVQPTTQDLSFTVPEEDQLNAVETDIMTIVTPEPGVALRKDMIVVQPTTQDLSFTVHEEDQLNAVETDIMTIVTPEPGVALRKDMIVVQPMTQDGVKTEIMTIITPEHGVALRKDLVLVQDTTVADEDLQLLLHPEAVTEYQPLGIPTVRADQGDDRWRNNEQQEPNEFYQYRVSNDIANQYHKPSGYQSQFVPNQDVSPNQQTQVYETGDEIDDTDILGQGDIFLTSNEHFAVDTAFDYDLSGPFMKTPLYTTSQTASTVEEVDEAPLVLVTIAPLDYGAMDEVFDQINTSPEGTTPPASELFNGSSEFGSEWVDFYKNPFPTKSRGETATTESESHAELHVLVDESDTGPSNSSFESDAQQKDHKIVNVSITGNIKAANVDFLSQILDLLRYNEANGNTQGGKPLLTDNANGGHLALVQHENSGISVGDNTIEIDGVRFNVTSVEQDSIDGKHQDNPPGASDISIHIDDNDSYQVSINRQKIASKKPTKNLRKYSFRNDNGHLVKTGMVPSDTTDDANDVQFEGNIDDDIAEKSMAPNDVESFKGRPLPALYNSDIEHRPADERRSSRFMRQILPAVYSRRRRQNPDAQLLQPNPVLMLSVWSSWGVWGPCSVSCGRGAVTRRRACLLAPSKEPCVGRSKALDECVMDACAEEEKQKKEVVQDEGHSTEVECQYDRTQTPKEIYWMSPTGEKITKDSTAFSKKFKMTGDILIVRGVQEADAGTYHCVVIMKDESSETSDAKIAVVTCTSQPCKNGATCEEHVAYNNGLIFKCSCTAGFEGHTCEQVSPVFVGEMSSGVLLLIIIVVIFLSVFVFGKHQEKIKKHKEKKTRSYESPREVIQMEPVPTDKPLLTEGEIDLFREISREEFKNFKASNTYSMFKGKRASRADATLDIETVEEPTEDPITKVDRKAKASSHKKISVIGLNKSQPGIEIRESADEAASNRKSSLKQMKTPVKKISSGDSISLHPSPAPDIEKVEQQRSTHFALSSQGQSSIEDVLSLASYQESKPRSGSGARLTPSHSTSLDEGKPRSGGSVSIISASSRTSTPKAKRSLFDADEPAFHSSRHDTEGIGRSRPQISVGSTVSVPSGKPSTPSAQSSFRQATTTQISAHSHVQHQPPLKTSSKYSASDDKSSIISASGHRIYSEAHRMPSVYGTDQTSHYSMEHTQPSKKSPSMYSTSRVETSNSSAKVRRIDEAPQKPSPYGALQRKSTSRLSTDSSGPRYQSNLSQHSSKERHSIVDIGTASSSRIYTAPLIVKSSSGNLRAVMPENDSHFSRRTSTVDSASAIHGSVSKGTPMEAVSPQISRVFSKGSTRIMKQEEVREIKSASKEWVPVTRPATPASPLGKQASALSGLQSAAASLGSIRKSGTAQDIQSPSKMSASSVGVGSVSSVSSGKYREIPGSEVVHPDERSSRIHSEAPLIIKSSSGHLRAVVPEEYIKESRTVLPRSPRKMSSHVSSIISSAGWEDIVSPIQTSPVSVSGSQSSSSQVSRAPQIVKSSSGNLRAVMPEGTDQDGEPHRPELPSRRASSRFTPDEPRMSVSAGSAADGNKPSLHSISKEVMASKVSSMESSPSRESRKISQSVLLLTRSQSPAGPIAPSSYHTSIGDLSETHSEHLSKASRFSLDGDASADATSHLGDTAADVSSVPLENEWKPLPEYDNISTETGMKPSALLVDKSSSKHTERQVDEVASSPSFTSTTDVMASRSQDHLSDWKPLEFLSADEGPTDDHTPSVNNVDDQYDDQEIREETDEWHRVPEVDTVNEAKESGPLEEIPSQKRRPSKFGYSGYVGRFSHILDTASEIVDAISTHSHSKMDEVEEHFPMDSSDQTPDGHVLENAGPPADRDSGDVSESFVSPQESLGHIFSASSQETLEDEEADFDDAREGNTDQEY